MGKMENIKAKREQQEIVKKGGPMQHHYSKNFLLHCPLGTATCIIGFRACGKEFYISINNGFL